jgi:hypothetical protein
MEKQPTTIKLMNPVDPEPDGSITDKLTGYRVQLWEQVTLLRGVRCFMVLYYRGGKWRRASPQMTNRVLAAAGLPQVPKQPMGPGDEMLMSVDDMIAWKHGPTDMRDTINVSRET